MRMPFNLSAMVDARVTGHELQRVVDEYNNTRACCLLPGPRVPLPGFLGGPWVAGASRAPGGDDDDDDDDDDGGGDDDDEGKSSRGDEDGTPLARPDGRRPWRSPSRAPGG